MATGLLIVCFVWWINIISANNQTDITSKQSVVFEPSKTYYTTDSGSLSLSEYDTLYDIYITYEYTPSAQSHLTAKSMGNIFAIATFDTFKRFNINIFNTEFCVAFDEYYNQTGFCSHYQSPEHPPDDHIAYGIFVGKNPNLYDQNIYDIVRQNHFKEQMANSIANLVEFGTFTIISVDIAIVEFPKYNDELSAFQLLDLVDLILYAQSFTFIGLCIFMMIIAKFNAIYLKHDDIRFLYFIYFMFFSLNFFANSIIFTLRIFEQKQFILGGISVLILFIVRLLFDASTAIKSKQIWITPAFSAKRVKEWYHKHEGFFISLSIISGPMGAITFTNSRLFMKDVFFMGVPPTMITQFIGNLFWKTFLIQRMPEFLIQIVFASINGYDNYFLFAFITTILCILITMSMKLQSGPIETNNEFSIHHTAFLMEISSAEINSNSAQYLAQPTAFKQAIAEVLQTDIKNVELPSFEAIKVSTESNCQNKKIYRCYGLKIHIAINTIMMSRREILMKLEQAQEDDTLVQKLMAVWALTDEPSIDDIVMVYDLSGDLVIQRPIEEPTLSVIGEENLRIMLENQMEKEVTIQHTRTESTNPFDHIPEIRHNRTMSRNPFDELGSDTFVEEEDEETSIDDHDEDTLGGMTRLQSIEFSLNSEKRRSTSKRVRRRQLSKIHIPDQSFVSLDMSHMSLQLDINNMSTHGIEEQDEELNPLRLHRRIGSASSIVSL